MGCTTTLPRKWEGSIKAGAARLFQVKFEAELARRWESKDWEVNDVIRLDNGYDAQCVTAGRSGQFEPPWPETLGEEVQDGSARWQIVEPSGDSLETTVSSFEWTAPTGITASGGQDTTTGSVRLVTVGSNVEPGEYEIPVKATCVNSEIIIQPCILTVE